ncbi:MAG: hypothetical protein WCI21_03025 [Alphaproteobacteria bacterium]
MIVLKGDLTWAEATGAAAAAPSAVRLPSWAPAAIPAGCIALGLIVGALADLFISATKGMAWEFGVVLGLAAYLVWRARPQWFGLVQSVAGEAPSLPWKLVMTAKTLGYDFGSASFRVGWTDVTALVPAGETWVFHSASGPVHAPRRLMAEPGAEKTFLKRALDHLGEAARSASPDAVRRST